MTAPDAATFFATAAAKRDEAEARADKITDRWLNIADRLLRLRFLGDAMIPAVLGALGHLEIQAPDRVADLTVSVWDCASLGTEFPAAPVDRDAFTRRGEVRGLNDGRFQAAFEAHSRLLSVMDGQTGVGLYCTADVAHIPRYDLAAPMRGLIGWFLRRHDRQLIHAGAVGHADGGVLLLGRSGAGKSNTALGCLPSSLRYASDDFCAVATAGPPMAYSVYSTGKTRESDWARHPFLAGFEPLRDPAGEEKAIYFLNKVAPHKLIGGFPLRAVLMVRRGGAAAGLRPIPAAAALTATAPDTALLLPDAGPEVLRGLAQVMRSVPCYELLLGPDASAVPGVIEGLLARPDVRRAAAV